MADGTCDLGDTPHGRNWLLTRISPPVTIELCDEDFIPGIVGLLAAELGLDFQVLYGSLERLLDKEAKKAQKVLKEAEEVVQLTGPSSDPLYAPDDAEALLDDPDDERVETGLFAGTGEEAV